MKDGEKLNHFLFMDDLDVFAKSKHEVNGLVSIVQTLSNDIEMELETKSVVHLY